MLAIGIHYEGQCTFSRTLDDSTPHDEIMTYMNAELGDTCDEIILVKNDEISNIITPE